QNGHAAVLVQGFLGPFDDGRGAGISFEVTALAAATHAAIGHFDNDMADFRAVAVFALQDGVVDDDAAADAGAEREHDHAASAAAGARPVLSVGRRVRVVLKGGRFVECILQMLADWHVLPGPQIRWVEDHAPRDVHGPRGGDADGTDVTQFQVGFGNG